MFGLQMQDVLVILIVALLLFGSTRLSEIGRGLGGALREFRQALSGDSEKVNETKEPKKE